jgi:hypothetical protein
MDRYGIINLIPDFRLRASKNTHFSSEVLIWFKVFGISWVNANIFASIPSKSKFNSVPGFPLRS